MDVDGPGAISDVPVEPDPYSSCSADSAFTSVSGSTSGSTLVFTSGCEIVAVVAVVVEGIAPPSFIDWAMARAFSSALLYQASASGGLSMVASGTKEVIFVKQSKCLWLFIMYIFNRRYYNKAFGNYRAIEYGSVYIVFVNYLKLCYLISVSQNSVKWHILTSIAKRGPNLKQNYLTVSVLLWQTAAFWLLPFWRFCSLHRSVVWIVPESFRRCWTCSQGPALVAVAVVEVVLKRWQVSAAVVCPLNPWK